MPKRPFAHASAAPAPTVKEPASRWGIYDELIAQIPEDQLVQEVQLGIHWTMVRAEGVGMAMTIPEGDRSIPGAGSFNGRPLRELAELAKSWNPMEAALGVAAINAHFNAPSRLEKAWNVLPETQANESIFTAMMDQLAGKKVTVVGHFPYLESLASICKLSILERKPLAGDFPDPACEYILEDQDYFFITGVTLINKTLPRLLELGRKAKIIMVGPSVPLTPLWFEWGVASLAGTVVQDAQRAWVHVAQGGDRSVFKHGARMVKLYPMDVRCA